MNPNQPEEWFEKYLYSPGDIYTGKCVPVANDTLAKLIAEASRRAKLEAWEEAKRMVGHVLTDDLVEVINSRIQQYGKENNT